MSQKRTLDHTPKHNKKTHRSNNLLLLYTFAQLPTELHEIIFDFAFGYCDDCGELKCELQETTLFPIKDDRASIVVCPLCRERNLCQYKHDLSRFKSVFIDIQKISSQPIFFYAKTKRVCFIAHSTMTDAKNLEICLIPDITVMKNRYVITTAKGTKIAQRI